MAERKQRSVSSKLGLIGGGLLLTGLAIVAVMYFAGRSELQNRLAALQQQGMPTTGRELNDFYVVPSSVPDTTQFWVAASDAVSGKDFGEKVKSLPILGLADPVPPMGEEWPLQAEATAALETKLKEELVVIRKATSMGGFARFPIDFTPGVNTMLPRTQELRSVSRILALDAHVAARNGDTQRLVNDLKDMVTASEALAVEPTIVSQLVRLAMFNMAIDAAKKLVPHCACTDQQLAELQQALMRPNNRDGLHRAFVGERAIGVEMIGSLAPAPFRADNQVLALDFYQDAVDHAESSGPEILKWQEEQKAKIKELSSSPISKFRYRGLMMGLPAVAQVSTAFIRSEADRRSLLLGLAAMRQSLRDRKYPDQLPAADLLGDYPNVTKDPFTDKPMLIKADETRLTYYSVGQNLEDDGGEVDLKDGMPRDWGFSFKKKPIDEAAPSGSAVVK